MWTGSGTLKADNVKRRSWVEISGRKNDTISRKIAGRDQWLNATPATRTVWVGLTAENEGARYAWSGWRSLRKIPGSSLKHPASGGREKIKVQTFQFGNAAWMMSLPRRLRRCTCLIIQLLAEHVCCQFTLREAPPMATYPPPPIPPGY